jgi:hypothetical protein
MNNVNVIFGAKTCSYLPQVPGYLPEQAATGAVAGAGVKNRWFFQAGTRTRGRYLGAKWNLYIITVMKIKVIVSASWGEKWEWKLDEEKKIPTEEQAIIYGGSLNAH